MLKKHILSSLLVFTCSLLSFGDDISGTVTESQGGAPIEGVQVTLQGQTAIQTLTAANGTFSLSTTAIRIFPNSLSGAPQIRWNRKNRTLYWDGYNANITIQVKTLKGASVSSFSSGASGLPARYTIPDLAQGVYFLSVTTGNRTLSYRFINLRSSAESFLQTADANDNSTVNGSAIAVNPLATNVLLFSKPGYQSVSRTIEGSQNDVNVQMAKSSDLTFNNGLVEVTYTTAGALSAKNLAANLVFIKSAQLSQSGGTAAYRDNVTENNLTGGKGVEISYSDGNKDRILLFPGSQFVYFKKLIGNTGSSDRTLAQINQVSAVVASKSQGSSLKAAGTAITVTDPNQKSYHFLALANPTTRNGVVGAWVTNDISSGIVQGGASGTDATLTGISEFGTLNVKPGVTREGDMFAIGYFDDALDGLAYNADDMARVYKIKMKPNEVVFCTWLSVGGAGNQSQMKSTSEWLNANLVDYGYTVAQIDDHWQNGDVEFDNGTSSSYSSGMKAVADVIKQNRLKPGIWFMPFAGTSGSSKFSSMYLKDKSGGTETSSWAQTSLDVTHPNTKAYITKITNQFVSWGYQYYKVDGMFTGLAGHQNYINDVYKSDDFFFNAVLNDKYQTPIEGYRNAWKLIIDLSPGVFIMGCTISQNMRTMQASFGLLDALRVGPDGSGTWDNIVNRGLIRAGRRYFYNGRTFWVDPDPVYPDMSFGQLMCTYNGYTGFMYNAIHSTDAGSFTALSAAQVDLLKRTMPFHGSIRLKAADFFERANPGIWNLTDERSGVRRDIIGLFNWNQGAAFAVNYPMANLGLDGSAQYIGFDFWANKYIAPFSGNVNQVLAAQGCRVISVRKVSGNPMVLSTNRHVADPVYSVEKEAWNGSVLSGKSKVVKNDPYELRIYAAKEGGGNWTAGDVTVSGGATVSKTQNGTDVRVTIQSTTNQTVDWSVAFN